MNTVLTESYSSAAVAAGHVSSFSNAPAMTRFGALLLQPSQILTVQSPLPGFEALQNFSLIAVAGQQPFVWLQSLEDASVAFLLVTASHFGLTYRGFDPSADVMVMVLLPEQSGQALRPHRQAPLVFDAAGGRFVQSVIEDGDVQGDGLFRAVTNSSAADMTSGLVGRLVLLAQADPDPARDSSQAAQATA